MGRARPGPPCRKDRHTVKRSHLQWITFACPSPHGVRVAWHAAFTVQPAQQGVGQPLDASLQPAALPPFFSSYLVSLRGGCFHRRSNLPIVRAYQPVTSTSQPRSRKGTSLKPLCPAALVEKGSIINPLRLCAFALDLFHPQKADLPPLSGKIGTCEA